jgi:hypothetical protein
MCDFSAVSNYEAHCRELAHTVANKQCGVMVKAVCCHIKGQSVFLR